MACFLQCFLSTPSGKSLINYLDKGGTLEEYDEVKKNKLKADKKAIAILYLCNAELEMRYEDAGAIYDTITSSKPEISEINYWIQKSLKK